VKSEVQTDQNWLEPALKEHLRPVEAPRDLWRRVQAKPRRPARSNVTWREGNDYSTMRTRRCHHATDNLSGQDAGALLEPCAKDPWELPPAEGVPSVPFEPV